MWWHLLGLLMFVLSGLCITLLLEMGLIKIGAGDFDNQYWVLSKVFMVRMALLAAATIQILHSIFTFRSVRNEQLQIAHLYI
jgi:hypothetical protein